MIVLSRATNDSTSEALHSLEIPTNRIKSVSLTKIFEVPDAKYDICPRIEVPNIKYMS